MVDIAHNLFSTRRGSILVGIGAAALAAIVVFVYLHNYRNSLNSSATPASVLVAKNLIQKGTPGNIIGQNSEFQVASIPKRQLQHGLPRTPSRTSRLLHQAQGGRGRVGNRDGHRRARRALGHGNKPTHPCH